MAVPLEPIIAAMQAEGGYSEAQYAAVINEAQTNGIETEAEEVIAEVKGCMDPESTNYNEKATVDDGSCKYPTELIPVVTLPEINISESQFINREDPRVIKAQQDYDDNISLLDLDIPNSATYDPAFPLSQGISTNEFNVGFTTEYIQTQASESNTGGNIQVNLGNNLNAMGLPKENGKLSFKWRTRAAETRDSGNTNAIINLPNNPTLFYIPLTANSGFAHLSGFLTWNCNDLLKDIDLSTKTITVPLIDITGTRTTFNLSNYYFTNVNVGVGTSMTGLTSGGYFYVDLYDITGCDSITTTTSTITAFVNY